jgi:hypothetical protein
MADKAEDEASPDDSDQNRTLEQVRKALADLRFGEIVVTVQDGVAVQLERTERTRLQRARRR